MINPDDEPSTKDGDNSSPNVARGATKTTFKKEYDSSTSSARKDDSISSKVEKDQLQGPVNSNVGRNEQDKSPLKMPNLESSVVKEVLTTKKDSNISNGSLVGKKERETTRSFSREKNANSVDTSKGKDEKTMLPGFALSTYKSSSINNEKNKQLAESSFMERNEQVNDPARQHEKLPPLAGANVMNVILVAAECAPWCKTGLYFHERLFLRVPLHYRVLKPLLPVTLGGHDTSSLLKPLLPVTLES